MTRVFAIGLLALSAVTTAHASIREHKLDLELNYNPVIFGSANEYMGLLGVEVTTQLGRHLYFGPAGYGAVAGERGGFFTGGFVAGSRWPILHSTYLDAGMFVGGGGGGAAPQGSGLMLRPHAALGLDFDDWALEGGLSYIEFPDGDIASYQFTLGVQVPFWAYTVAASDLDQPLFGDSSPAVGPRRTALLANLVHYMPDDGVDTTEGETMMPYQRLGFEWRQWLSPHHFALFETAGALGGEADGFAEIYGGAGVGTDWRPGWTAYGSASIGAAGGGRVDTGGGLAGKVRLGQQVPLVAPVIGDVHLGRMETQGGYAGYFAGVSLGTELTTLGRDTGADAALALAELNMVARPLRLVAFQHSAFDAQRKNVDDLTLGHVGLLLEQFVTDHVYLTGQAHGAYAGEAGGYAVGLIGAGAEWAPWEPIRAGAELAFGAAGGGGVDVGDGAVIQPTASLTWQATPAVGFRVTGGRVIAPTGDLNSPVLGFGVSYTLGMPMGL